MYYSKEFTDYQAINQALGIQAYFVDPYCSWQRGRNENFNCLLRQYFPKKRLKETVTGEEFDMIEKNFFIRPESGLNSPPPRGVSSLVKPCCSS